MLVIKMKITLLVIRIKGEMLPIASIMLVIGFWLHDVMPNCRVKKWCKQFKDSVFHFILKEPH